MSEIEKDYIAAKQVATDTVVPAAMNIGAVLLLIALLVFVGIPCAIWILGVLLMFWWAIIPIGLVLYFWLRK